MIGGFCARAFLIIFYVSSALSKPLFGDINIDSEGLRLGAEIVEILAKALENFVSPSEKFVVPELSDDLREEMYSELRRMTGWRSWFSSSIDKQCNQELKDFITKKGIYQDVGNKESDAHAKTRKILEWHYGFWRWLLTSSDHFLIEMMRNKLDTVKKQIKFSVFMATQFVIPGGIDDHHTSSSSEDVQSFEHRKSNKPLIKLEIYSKNVEMTIDQYLVKKIEKFFNKYFGKNFSKYFHRLLQTFEIETTPQKIKLLPVTTKTVRIFDTV